MSKIKVNPDNLTENFNMIWEKSVEANHLISELWQALLKHGYVNPMSPEFVNTLLEKCINPARENCRNMTQIALECMKDVNNIKHQAEKLASIDHELDA